MKCAAAGPEVPGTNSLAVEIASTAEKPGSVEGNAKAHMPPEERSMNSEAEDRPFIDNAQMGTLILNAHTGAILDVNPSLARMLNYSPEELLGKTLWEIVLPRDADASKRMFQELLAKGKVHYDDIPLMAKGGPCIGVEVIGKVYQMSKDKVVKCNIRGTGQHETADMPEQRIRQKQEMEAVGQLAVGLAHDLNNLLAVILKCCEDLEEQASLPVPSRKMILEIHNAGTSAKNLTQRLLPFSRGQVAHPTVIDLNETVTRMESMLGRMIGDEVELVCLLGEGLGSINADPSQMEQVLMNLAINARDAMPNGGKIVIETANIDVEEANARQHPSMQLGRHVMLSVSDTGTGMDTETQSRIFEPFFTTKPAGQGSGLGLSTVFSVAQQSGGVIAVQSKPGEGSTFKILFPRSDRATGTMRPKTEPVRGGTETILLVDDAASLRKLIRRLLEECGYAVLDSGDPAAALRMAEEHSGPIPLMITDVVLPGFSGSDLSERVTKSRPGIKVLYVSGYSDDSIASSSVTGQNCAFLKKPFTRNDLLRTVRQLLDSR